MKALLDILASKVLALGLLGALFTACAVGTLFPLPVALGSVYHSPWFLALLGLFALNTLACVAAELLRRKVAAGFLLLHLGPLLILAGGAAGYLAGEKGRVAIPEGGAVSYFYPEWKGADRLDLEGGAWVEGRFEAFEKGDILFTQRGGESSWIPLDWVRELRLDPDRPGRRLESDVAELEGGERISGFVESVETTGFRIRTGEGAREVAPDQVKSLEMGDPAVRPLGFALRLDAFRIEHYEEAGFRKLYALGPQMAAKRAVLPAVEGAEADLGSGYRVRIRRYIPDAVVDRQTKALEKRSDLPRNPAVELEIEWEGGREVRPVFEREMPGGHGSAGSSGVLAKLVVSGNSYVKSYISEVSVLEEGSEARTGTIEVNAPLAYEGYSFYQADFKESGGRFRSIFDVVKDPGLPFAYAGFAMLFLGAVLVCWGKPLLAALRRTAPAEPRLSQ